MAFLQSSRCDDRVRLVCEGKDNSEKMPCGEYEPDSSSDEEGVGEMPPLTDSEMSEIEEEEGDRVMPPLTDGEESEIEEESEDPDRKEDAIVNERNLNLEPSKRFNKAKRSLTKKKSSL